jgi:hypothetical protein
MFPEPYFSAVSDIRERLSSIFVNSSITDKKLTAIQGRTMINRWHRIIFIIIISFFLVKCIDPYTPRLRSFESRLVVDALVTDENTSNYVRLTRTTLLPDDEPVKVTGARVTIPDDLGGSFILEERYPGDYRTDSLSFRGEVGRTYTITIETSDGDRYESVPCRMYPVPGIDSLYYGRDQFFSEEEAASGRESHSTLIPGMRLRKLLSLVI